MNGFRDKVCNGMKGFNVIFVFTIVVLLITAGCTSDENPAQRNDASNVFVEDDLLNHPGDTPEEQDIGTLIVGDWKIQTGDNQVLYWRFHNDGTLTGGSEPGSRRITGNWSTFGFEKYIFVDATDTQSDGEHITYNMAITRDPANGSISVDNPAEYTTWEFIRQS
jgi:hypothetical protein